MKGEELYRKMFLKSEAVNLASIQDIEKMYKETKEKTAEAKAAINNIKASVEKAITSVTEARSVAWTATQEGYKLEDKAKEIGVQLPKEVVGYIDEMEKISKEFNDLKASLKDISSSIKI